MAYSAFRTSDSTLGLFSHGVSFLASQFGMVLVSGPTGSDKTTTLYGSVAELIKDRGNIITVENPLENRMVDPNPVRLGDGVCRVVSPLCREPEGVPQKLPITFPFSTTPQDTRQQLPAQCVTCPAWVGARTENPVADVPSRYGRAHTAHIRPDNRVSQVRQCIHCATRDPLFNR